MESLPKDVQRKIALDFSPPDLINFCLSNKDIYNNICNSKDFWRRKLAIDFPYIVSYFVKNNLILANPKATYIKKFTEVSQKIENFIKQEFHFGADIMYDVIYRTYIKWLNNSLENVYLLYLDELRLNEKLKSMDPKEKSIYLSQIYKEGFSRRFTKLMSELLNKDKAYGIIRF